MDDHLQTAFVRQRRNLIIITIILAIIEIADLRLKTINILGNVFDIGHPEVIPWFLWTAFGYFLLRYSQYLNSLQNVSIKRDYKKQLEIFSNAEVSDLIYRREGIRMFAITDRIVNEENNIITNIVIHAKYEIDNNTKHKEYEFKGVKLLLLKFKTIKYLVIESHIITEYILPFILAGILLIYIIYEKSLILFLNT